MRRIAATLATTLCLAASTPGLGADSSSEGIERWKFLIGDWSLVEQRYGFDSRLIQTNAGHSSFSAVMDGRRIEELQTVVHGADTTIALHVFVYDPNSREFEIARTDSDHFGFWVIAGPMTDGRLELVEKHPDPGSEITRRITYLPGDDRHFRRRLEFSRDGGRTWFTRSEWLYTRD